MTIEVSQVQQFLTYLSHEKRYSKHTRLAYEKDLTDFMKFANSNSLAQWSTIQSQNVRGFVATLNRAGQSPKTIQRKLSSLRSFYAYLMRESLVEINPVEGIRAPKAGKKLPNVLDVDQVHGLLTVAPEDILSIRDLAMLELFYGCGLRLSELTGLDVKDIDFNQTMVRTIGKGGKTRQIPLGKFAVKAINNWLKVRDQWVVYGQTALFLSQRGNRIANRTVQARLKHWGDKTGLGTSLHPHQLRHSFASHLLESSGDIRAVQELLGHANLSTTQIYTHLDFQHLAQVYDKAHPRAKKKTAG